MRTFPRDHTDALTVEHFKHTHMTTDEALTVGAVRIVHALNLQRVSRIKYSNSTVRLSS